MSYPAHLTGLTTREAITDAIYRATIGLDNNDIELSRSAFINQGSQPIFFMGEQAWDVDQMMAVAGPLITTHFTSNIRIDVKDGESTAVLTAYALNQHYKAGEGNSPAVPGFIATGNPNKNVLSGGQYVVDMEKDAKDGVWKIKKWVFNVLWSQGDFSIMGH